MRRFAIAAMGTLSGLVLVFSYDASIRGTHDGLNSLNTSETQASDTQGAQDPAASPSGSSTGQAKSVATTFTGDVADTRWGPVQVRITVTNGKITKAKAIQFPNENDHDQEINSYAVPQLEKATVQANGSDFDSVSGATVTSGGYKESLQSALDKAHL
jgi:uncharacterized protein with FMN-binding domain